MWWTDLTIMSTNLLIPPDVCSFLNSFVPAEVVRDEERQRERRNHQVWNLSSILEMSISLPSPPLPSTSIQAHNIAVISVTMTLMVIISSCSPY